MGYVFSTCTLCPRRCGRDRTKGVGFCGVTDRITIARAALHFWEEPCIAGETGAGAIFFSGCPLHCIYCQNDPVSRGAVGKTVSPERLQEICFALKSSGAATIDLVTPCHFAPQIREAILPVKEELGLPIVVNTGSYDSAEQLSCFRNLADVYLPDFKYLFCETAKAFSDAPDYPQVAFAALDEMLAQTGKPVKDEKGILRSGVLLRHLILPGHRKESEALLRELYRRYGNDSFLLAVMSQYSPMPGALPPLHRRITTFEQQSVCNLAEELGFSGYFQDRSSAKEEYIPPFDLTGV